MKYTVTHYYQDGEFTLGIVKPEGKSAYSYEPDGIRVCIAVLNERLEIISRVNRHILGETRKGAYFQKNRKRYYLRDFKHLDKSI